MKKILFLVFIISSIILTISLISAVGQEICVDFSPPSAPSNLVLTNSGLNIQLSWTAATDKPSCSGISHYDIYRSFNNGNFTLINNFTITTNYLDNSLNYGKYAYIVHAWDLAGHNEGNGVSNSIVLERGGGSGGSSGGGGGGGTIESYWKCGNWGDCITNFNSSSFGIQTRVCTDVAGLQFNRTESKPCIPNFVPLSFKNNGNGSSLSTNNTNVNNGNKTHSGSFLTGAVTGLTGFAKSKSGIFLLIFIFLIIIGAGAVLLKDKPPIKWIKKHWQY